MQTVKVTPTVEDIQFEPETKCLQPGCLKSFRTSSNLEMHLKKHHNIDQHLQSRVKYPSKAEYHCPIDSCFYSATSVRFFRTFQLLKQHYNKVHGEKKFACEKCDKKFTRPYELKRHEAICGIDQKCSCGYSYSSHEALLTHARRYGHELPPEFQPKKKKLAICNGDKVDQPTNSSAFVNKEMASVSVPVVTDKAIPRKLIKIMPKFAPISCLPLPTVAAIALSELSTSTFIPIIAGKMATSTQTSVANYQNKPQKYSKIKRSQNSTQTQTTAVPCSPKSLKASPNKLAPKSRKKRVRCESTESQTNLIGLQKHKCPVKNQKPIWECIDKDEMGPLHVSTDVMLSDFNLRKNTSATQTSPRIINSQTSTISHSSNLLLDSFLETSVTCHNYNANVHTQTDLDFNEFLPLEEYLLGAESIGQTLNSETQTTENFLETLDCSQLFTNMETQTGENLFSLGLNFSTIHTQTSWDENFDNSADDCQSKFMSAELKTSEQSSSNVVSNSTS